MRARRGRVRVRPGEGEARPGENEARPGEDEAKSGEDEARPGEDETRPGEGEARPGEGGARPGEGESNPVTKLKAILENEDAIVEWVATRLELYDRGHCEYYIKEAKHRAYADKHLQIFIPNAPRTRRMLPERFPYMPYAPGMLPEYTWTTQS